MVRHCDQQSGLVTTSWRSPSGCVFVRDPEADTLAIRPARAVTAWRGQDAGADRAGANVFPVTRSPGSAGFFEGLG
jgi:hypothetical protein